MQLIRNGLFIAFALIVQTGIASKDTLKTYQPDTEDIHILDALDSLTTLLYTTNSFAEIDYEDLPFEEGEVPVYDDEVYQERLALIPSPINFTYNDAVKKYIELYVVHRRQQAEKILSLSQLYFPLFEEVLDKYDLPLELKYLPIIESALNPHAVSRAGATGLWQFMYPTGRMYKLEINSYIDHRRDPALATDAAARYLKDLYGLYGDWAVALAAYNCGPGNVNKAIRRSGGKTDYWEIRPYLPAETRGYVPAFFAATYFMSYHKEHNLMPVSFKMTHEILDTVMIAEEVTLEQIAKYIDMPAEELAFLNPALKKGVIPYSEEGYALNLPMSRTGQFIAFKDSIFYESPVPVADLEDDKPELNDSEVVMASTKKDVPTSKYSAPKPNYDGLEKMTYTVKSGDNLGYIASWYDCNVSEIKRWNNMRSSTIYVGQQLNIYVNEKQASKYRNINNLSLDQKQRVEHQKNSPSSNSEKKTSAPSNSGKHISYTIKPGDTLWDLAKAYPKNTVDSIKRLNNITDNRSIKPGLVIKLAI